MTKDGDKPEVVRIMLRVIYQAAKTQFEIASQDVVHLDIANGERTHGSHEDAALATTIDNGCNALRRCAEPPENKNGNTHGPVSYFGNRIASSGFCNADKIFSATFSINLAPQNGSRMS